MSGSSDTPLPSQSSPRDAENSRSWDIQQFSVSSNIKQSIERRCVVSAVVPLVQRHDQWEKDDAKNYILIEDSIACINDRTPESLSHILNSEVREVLKYRIGRRCFALLRLADYFHFLRTTSPRHVDSSFPIHSRMFLLKTKATSEAIKYPPVKQLGKGTQEINDLLKRRDIEEAMDRLVAVSGMSRLGSKLRFFLLNQIEEVVCNGCFRDFELLPFGSSVNGFGSDSSDLDIAMGLREERKTCGHSNQDLMHMPLQMQSESELYHRLIDFVGNHLKYFVPGITRVRKISRAHVPIVKLHSELTGLHCDISFQSAHVSSRTAHVLFDYSMRDERVVKLMTFIKIWAKEHLLTQPKPSPCFSNFMMMILVVHFFQTRPGFRLPAMNACSQTLASSHRANENMSFETIMRQFFEFICVFDFKDRGISVLDGHSISKPSDDAVYMENLLEKFHNASGNVSQSEVHRLVQAANSSLTVILSSSPYSLSDLCKATTNPMTASHMAYDFRSKKAIPIGELSAD